jgi:hypothetical protein
MFRGDEFDEGDEYPDGKDPAKLIEAWAPWVCEAVVFMDGDGAVRHWKYEGSYADQPAFDQSVYSRIRSRWIELRNEDLKRKK